IVSGPLQVRLAESAADIDAAQALRYRIFYEIMGALPLPGMEQRRRDSDGYDQICDHLLVFDHSWGSGAEAVVGTYRLIRRDAAARFGAFYSAAEYDIARLIAYPGEILELGRSRGARSGPHARRAAALDQRVFAPRRFRRRWRGHRPAVQHHRCLHRGQDRSRRRKVFAALRAAIERNMGGVERMGSSALRVWR